MRIPGGIYLCTPLSPIGSPVESFLICPPMPLPEGVTISAQGVSIVQGPDGNHHVLDWIGESHYPNVADWIEETRRKGISRRIQSSAEFEKLTENSRLYVIHPKAILSSFEEREKLCCNQGLCDFRCCPKAIRNHPHPDETCAVMWWHDVMAEPLGEGWKTITIEDKEFSFRLFTDFHYRAEPVREERKHQPGIFGSFPIRSLEIVRRKEGSTAEEDAHVAKSWQRANTSRLPVSVVEE